MESAKSKPKSKPKSNQIKANPNKILVNERQRQNPTEINAKLKQILGKASRPQAKPSQAKPAQPQERGGGACAPERGPWERGVWSALGAWALETPAGGPVGQGKKCKTDSEKARTFIGTRKVQEPKDSECGASGRLGGASGKLLGGPRKR